MGDLDFDKKEEVQCSTKNAEKYEKKTKFHSPAIAIPGKLAQMS